MKILTHHTSETVRYAAEELVKYVRLITKCEINPTIEYTDALPEKEDGAIVLGLLGEMGLDTSDLSDPFVEDIIDIKLFAKIAEKIGYFQTKVSALGGAGTSDQSEFA